MIDYVTPSRSAPAAQPCWLSLSFAKGLPAGVSSHVGRLAPNGPPTMIGGRTTSEPASSASPRATFLLDDLLKGAAMHSILRPNYRRARALALEIEAARVHLDEARSDPSYSRRHRGL